VLAASWLAACTSTGTSTSTSTSTSVANDASAGTSGAASAVQQEYQSVVKAVLPSVVQISTSSAIGSGVVYDGKGDIVTNAHVVGNAQTMEVLSSTGDKTLPATVVGVFSPDDLAVIKVTSGAGTLRPARFGSSADAQAGQIVLAMGSPLGLTGTVTEGIISATGRTVSEGGAAGGAPTTIANALQTSAAINSGNSGGALVNLAREVIGIPTAAAQNPSSGNQAAGIGFAIPSDTVKNIAGQLISTGKVSNSGRAALGIHGQDAVAPSGEPAGVTVASVTPNGPAAHARLEPGDKVTVKYVRNGTIATTTVTLGSLSS
jgi:S1-C subfamily serine protease